MKTVLSVASSSQPAAANAQSTGWLSRTAFSYGEAGLICAPLPFR